MALNLNISPEGDDNTKYDMTDKEFIKNLFPLTEEEAFARNEKLKNFHGPASEADAYIENLRKDNRAWQSEYRAARGEVERLKTYLDDERKLSASLSRQLEETRVLSFNLYKKVSELEIKVQEEQSHHVGLTKDKNRAFTLLGDILRNQILPDDLRRKIEDVLNLPF